LTNNNADICSLLTGADKNTQFNRRELLHSLCVNEEYFEEGNIQINTSTCRGVECKLCIKACPTNALFWSEGEVKIERSLCIYCGACVLNCIVDDCIRIKRKRRDGAIEEFSTPREAILVMNNHASDRRREAINKRSQAGKEQ